MKMLTNSILELNKQHSNNNNYIGICEEERQVLIEKWKVEKEKTFQEKNTGYKKGEGQEPICNLYGLHEESFEVIGNKFD